MKKHFYISLIVWMGIAMSAFPQSMTISGGDSYGMIICAKGLVYAWGSNTNQVLGIDPAEPGATPSAAYITSPQKVKIPAGITFQQVIAGSGAFSTALSCQNIVYCWGANANGECGQNNTQAVIPYPQPVLKGVTAGSDEPGMGAYLGNVTYIAAATSSAYAILENGRCVSWGSNKSGGGAQPNGGQLGAGLATTANATTPVWVVDGTKAGNPPLENVIHVAGGDYTAYFLVDDGSGNGTGTVYSCGDWLGRANTNVNVARPVLKEDGTQLTGISMMAGGDVIGVAVEKATGNVYGWGNNPWGCAAGIPGNAAADRAKQVVSGTYTAISGEAYLTDVVEVVGLRGAVAAITKEGYMLYWGNNDLDAGQPNGGLVPNGFTGGDLCATGPQFAVYCPSLGAIPVNPAPTNPNVIKDAVHLARGDNFGFMVNDKNEYFAWGRNDKGQLGIGNTTNQKCLTKLTNIPCELSDPMPTAFMPLLTEKCFGKSFDLYCGFTPAIGKESLYDYTWYYTAPGGVEIQLTGTAYEKNEITIDDPGFYRVEVAYNGVNAPCNVVDIVEASTTVADKVMPIDTFIITSCVANPLSPAAGDDMNFKVTSKYTIESDFNVYATENSTTILEAINFPVGSSTQSFSIKGNNIAASEVSNNAPVDTTYTVWLEDVTKEKGTVVEGVNHTTDGGSQRYYALLECWSDIELTSVKLCFQSHYGSKIGYVTPVIYNVIKNNNRDMPGTAVWTGTQTEVNYNSDRIYCEAIDLGNRVLTGNPSRGTRYYLGFTFTDIDKVMRSTRAVGSGENDYIFTTSFKDDIDQSTLLVIGAAKDGNPTSEYIIADLKFNKTSAYDCGRIKITTRYWCPPCEQPNLVNGKYITITPSQAAVNDTVRLCSESLPLTLTANITKSTGNFDILWYDNKNGTEIQTASDVTSSVRLGSIAWSDLTPGASKKYYAKVRDNNKPSSTDCWAWDSVIVKANPKPVVPENTKVGNFCASTTPPELPTHFPGFASYQWYDESKDPVSSISSEVAGDPGIHNYYLTVSDSYGCVSDTVTIPVEVVASPDVATVYREVVYYRTDIQSDGKFLNLFQQDPGFMTPVSGTVDLLWLQSDGVTWDKTVPIPPTPDPSDFTDKTYTYRVKRIRKQTPSCESEAVTVTAKIYLIPVPKVSSLSYCLNELADPLTAEIDPTPPYTSADYDLRWYADETTPTFTDAPTPLTNVAGVTTYYVSQYNRVTSAPSSRVGLTVTVYPKPDLQTFNQNPVCTPTTVNITTKGTAWSVSNEATLPVTEKYYSDAEATTELTDPTALSAVGINNYYIQAAFTMPANAAKSDYCYSEPKSIQVNIQDLTPLIDEGTTSRACPGSSVTLNSSTTTYTNNSGPMTYNWSGNGQTGTTATFNTGTLPATPGTEVPVTLTVSMGSCVNKTAPVHKITIGDGPVDGTMTIYETDNDYDGTVYTDDEAKKFYSCGGAITITTNYKADAFSAYRWYENDVQVGSGTIGAGGTTAGVDYSVPARSTSGTVKYKLEYVNECPTSVELTIVYVPITVTPDQPKMQLCEEDPFEVNLTVNCVETPTIKWLHNGSPLSATDKKLRIESVTPANSGYYKYEVTNRGCKVEGDIIGVDVYGNPGVDQVNVSGKVTWDKMPAETICEGAQLEVGLNSVSPSTSVLTWSEPNTNYNTILQVSPNKLTALVEPPFVSDGSAHRTTYTYRIKATNIYCSKDIDIEVYVDEPLTGSIDAKTPICEGQSTTINASSYDADSYTWTSEAMFGEKQGAVITEYTPFTAYYYLSVVRGECSKPDSIEIEVNSNPRIKLIDSIGVRDREIIAEPGYGTHPFSYGVDDQPLVDDSKMYGLRFELHRFYIVDALGCRAESVGYLLEAPKLFPPAHFSPNGDGFFDKWDIPGMQEIYPDAKVTIYDRYGKKLIEYRGEDMGWDGTYLGNPMPTTDYWYEIEIKEINKQYIGHFTLLRR